MLVHNDGEIFNFPVYSPIGLLGGALSEGLMPAFLKEHRLGPMDTACSDPCGEHW